MQHGVTAQNAAVAVLDSHQQVEESVQRLRQSGFDLSKLSVVARERQPEQQVVAHYGADGQARYWGECGRFWTGMWASLSGWACIAIPGTGPILVAGPLGGWIVAALENEVVFGGLSALGAALYGLGIPKDAVLRNEAAVRMDKLLLIVHGTVDEVGRARGVLNAAIPFVA
jgi:hypothetical protein